MEPWLFRARCSVAGGVWSAPTHLSWVAGGGPGEPDTEVADHVRLYDDGDGWAGCACALGAAGGRVRRRVARGADACLRRGGGRACAAPLAGGALLLGGGPDRLRSAAFPRRAGDRLRGGGAGLGGAAAW